ncbi:MAG: hypothetical protein ACRC33_09430 [Gemmataceae bacterium]
METTTVPVVTVDADALAQADRVGMRSALDHMLAATPRLVPGLRSVHVRLKPDWDEPGKMNFVWDVRMEATTTDILLAANREWGREFVRVAPRPREHSFLLKLLDDRA